MEPLRIGELARRTGLTVRTLHHYDAIGLLSPAGRSAAGYRLYGRREVRRLVEIVALKRLGLSLDEIGECLARTGPGLRHTLALQAERLRQQIELDRQLLARLEALLHRLDTPGAELPAAELTQIVEMMTMHEQYYTPEQRQQLARRRDELGEAGMRRAEAEWRQLFASFRSAMERGDDPASEPVAELARRAAALIGQFTGGDPGIARSLSNMYEKEGADAVLEPHGFDSDPALFDYMRRASEALRER